MMINTVIEMEKYSQGGGEYSCFVYVFCIYFVSKTGDSTLHRFNAV